MLERINEPISVIASFGRGAKNTVKVRPYAVSWRKRRYMVETFGLYHPERRGSKLVHIFSFAAEGTNFRVELNPETLEWLLTEVYYESG